MKRRTLLALLPCLSTAARTQPAAELRFCLSADPRTLHPLKVEEQASETVRYLTGGVLIRINRLTQRPEPELAVSWKISPDGRRIEFQLREGVKFSDGSPFTAEDVAHTFRQLSDPALQTPTADSFRSKAGPPAARVSGPHKIAIHFPAPLAGLERLFDQLPILSASSAQKEAAVLGPFHVGERKPGAYLLLARNPHYWKRDEQGRRLPYLDAVRLEIQQNRELEILRFRRGQLHLINNLTPDLYTRLAAESPGAAHDSGPSLNSDFLWFNQVAAAPIPAHKKAWFRSAAFRGAISGAISREDIARVVYQGHARPAAGPVSPANRFWYNHSIKPHLFDRESSFKRLAREGFRRDAHGLKDAAGNPVEFSIVTNAGNKPRERMAAMIQQDLAAIGIKLNIVTLDFPSLIERITRTFQYESCLLGLVNVDLDPNSQMNVWLSSSSSHQWNPNQKQPETAWEAEIDRLMQLQASTLDPQKRKAAFDAVQKIVWEQQPFIYLVHQNSLAAVSPAVRNLRPAALHPNVYWNIDRLALDSRPARGKQ